MSKEHRLQRWITCPVCGSSDAKARVLPSDTPYSRVEFTCDDCGVESHPDE